MASVNEIVKRLRTRYGEGYTVEAMLREEAHLLNLLAEEACDRGEFAEQELLGREAIEIERILSDLRADHAQ